ncbi:MAG TPA: hypothetical protein VFR02_07705, partial [bacterium]|nr:hypothetical protein [bacterium]
MIPPELQKHLELCRRLGIRYLSPMGEAPSQAPETRPSPAQAAPSAVAATPPEGGAPPWLTAPGDTARALKLTAFDREICACQKCPLG